MTDLTRRDADAENSRFLRNIVRSLIENAEPSDLRDRLLRELRRGHDGNSHHRRRKHEVMRVAREWIDGHIRPDDFEGDLLAEAVFERFIQDTGHDRRKLGMRSFYQLLREAGYAVESVPGQPAFLCNAILVD